ncbi:hypothetical protein B0T16DRAFT_421667 [Cercophora newfieldiana]|uniref:Pentatricopeptide repeat-containing protein n=1 Tax=Cercophora newfieldiana TaxID=92897 RepID=A0AA40CHL0_9PEZI|nr:hypothetical protein B0T16DRAFT_421667 [Cercophora newfieldiana]
MSELHEDKGYENAVVECLASVFRNEEAAAVASLDAFKMALAYLSPRSPTTLHQSWEIFRVMGRRRMMLDTQVMNLVLLGAVQASDLARAHRCLEYMARLQLQASPRTWVLILRLIQVEEIRRYILSMMHRRGLLDMPGMVTEMASSLADHDVYRAIQLKQNLETSVASQTALYGPRWLGHYSANKILQGYGRYGKLDDMYKIVNLMFASKTAKPSEVTFSTAMAHCRILGSLRWAIKFLRLFERHGQAIDDSSLREVFRLIYNRKRPIMLGMVWRYARLHKLTTYHMRWRVGSLVKGSLPSSPRGETTKEQKMARAKVKQLFCHIQGGLSEAEQQRLVQALFPQPVLSKGGVRHILRPAPEGRLAESKYAVDAETTAAVMDRILRGIEKLGEMVNAKEVPLSRLLLKAEVRDGALSKQAPLLLQLRKRGRSQRLRAKRISFRASRAKRVGSMPRSVRGRVTRSRMISAPGRKRMSQPGGRLGRRRMYSIRAKAKQPASGEGKTDVGEMPTD